MAHHRPMNRCSGSSRNAGIVMVRVAAHVIDESWLPMCLAVANGHCRVVGALFVYSATKRCTSVDALCENRITEMQTNAAVRTMIAAHVCRCRLRC